jgi:hypothetical protein
MSHKEKPGYLAFVKIAVDILLRCGLPLHPKPARSRCGALDLLSEVLYQVWPDDRRLHKSGALRRDARALEVVHRQAKKFADERERSSRRLPTFDELDLLSRCYWGKHVTLGWEIPGATANSQLYVWIPDRPR